MYEPHVGWHGYADAKPSESIQKHELPGLAVAVVFPHKPGEDLLDIPIGQYKQYKITKKANYARVFSDWLTKQKENGLVLTGFVNSHARIAAAQVGMELIEELPYTHVEPHYNSFRLNFDGEYIDFAHAVALEYYYLTISFGISHAADRIHGDHRKLFVAMDRFPGASTKQTQPGQFVPVTQGIKFIEFIRTRSKTGIGLIESDKSVNLQSDLGTLDWWKPKTSNTWRKGKTHPHFVLPDWLAASAIAHQFRDDFIASITKDKVKNDIADALDELYYVFKTFDLWSMDDNVPQLLRASEKLWEIPDNAREFILKRL